MFGVRYISDRKQVETTRIQPVFNQYFVDLETTYSGGSRDGCWTILRFAEGFGSEDFKF